MLKDSPTTNTFTASFSGPETQNAEHFRVKTECILNIVQYAQLRFFVEENLKHIITQGILLGLVEGWGR